MYTEEVKRLNFSTTRTITGTLDEVLTRIKEVITTWHPLLYGTRCIDMHYIQGDPTEWSWVATVHHYNNSGD